MAQILKGAPVAASLTEELTRRVSVLAERGITPKLAIVRVGERDDDLSYERGAEKRCAKVGIEVEKFLLPSDCSQQDLLDAIARVNADASIHGCLMFRPLPKTLDEQAVCAALDPAKDMDCITEGSLFGVFAGRPKGFPPCTAEAVMELLRFYGYDLGGANVTVIGRSLVIGKPVSMMLQAANATVTMCHTKTRDVAAACKGSEVVVVAAGHMGTFDASCAAPGQTVIDVGINWDESAGKLAGDVDFDAVEPIVSAITPVPGGVGSVTTACLAKHVVEAAERTVS